MTDIWYRGHKITFNELAKKVIEQLKLKEPQEKINYLTLVFEKVRDAKPNK